MSETEKEWTSFSQATFHLTLTMKICSFFTLSCIVIASIFVVNYFVLIPSLVTPTERNLRRISSSVPEKTISCMDSTRSVRGVDIEKEQNNNGFSVIIVSFNEPLLEKT